MSHKRVDQNQTTIVDALRQHGASVISLATLGKGCPDILIGYHEQNILAEIKGKHGKLNTLQRCWHDNWRGARVIVLRTVEDAYACLQHQ